VVLVTQWRSHNAMMTIADWPALRRSDMARLMRVRLAKTKCDRHGIFQQIFEFD
jgi:hypothetical protein